MTIGCVGTVGHPAGRTGVGMSVALPAIRRKMTDLHTDVRHVIVKVDGETRLDYYRSKGGIDVIVNPVTETAER